MKNALKKIIVFVLYIFMLCSSCTFFPRDIPSNYPNSVWKSQSDDPIYVVLNVDLNGKMTSEVTYNGATLEFTNKITSEVMYFYLVNADQIAFNVSHSFVKNGDTIKCEIWHNFEKVFSLDEPVNLSFTLTKVSG